METILKKKETLRKHSFVQTLGFASNGIAWFFITERNGKLQAMVLVAVLLASFYFGLSMVEWCIVLLCGGLVIALEMINTAIEQVCNDYHPGYKQSIQFIKDTSAGAVLVASILSIVIGLIIFLPKVLAILQLINSLKKI